MGGAFQTSREIFDNPIWKNIVEFRLFFLIYGNAVFSDEGVRLADDLVLQRGEWCRSTRKIQEDLTYIENRQVKTYSTSVINRCIKKLEQSQRICTRIHDLGTVFTVLNYEQYQGFSNYGLGNLERNLEHSGNSVGTVEEQSGNNNKKVKNEKNAKNEKKVNKDIVYSPEFEKFWDSYPEEKRVGKPAAFNNFKKLLKKHDAEYIIACAMNYSSYCLANGTDKQYMKMPNNFLNGKDEYYKQYETPVLIHNRSARIEPPRKETPFEKIQRLAKEAEEREASGHY